MEVFRMKLAHAIVFWGTILSIQRGAGQLSRFQLDDDDRGGSPGQLPPGISPPGESPSGSGRACCANLPVVIPPPQLPLPICPGGLPPLYDPVEENLVFCLPTSETCPPNSACWYNGINYYCCPMEPGPGYGRPTPAPLGGVYGGAGRPGGKGRPLGGGGRRPGGTGGEVNPPGILPKGINPPSDSGGSSEEGTAPRTIPKGINPPSDGSEENANPPGGLAQGIRPPAKAGGIGAGPYAWKQKARPRGYGGGLQPPPFGAGGFPNPFTCCGGGFQAPSHLPRNINAPSERAIGVIQFHSGSNVWPPKETGKAKFGGPIKPDFLWFPGHHPHFTNELGCCGEGGGAYGGGSSNTTTPQPSSGSSSTTTPQPSSEPPTTTSAPSS